MTGFPRILLAATVLVGTAGIAWAQPVVNRLGGFSAPIPWNAPPGTLPAWFINPNGAAGFTSVAAPVDSSTVNGTALSTTISNVLLGIAANKTAAAAAAQTAGLAVPASEVGAPAGVAPLNSAGTSGQVPAIYLPFGNTPGTVADGGLLATVSSTASAAQSAATQAQNTANAAIPGSKFGTSGGVATLDGTGSVPASQMGNVGGATLPGGSTVSAIAGLATAALPAASLPGALPAATAALNTTQQSQVRTNLGTAASGANTDITSLSSTATVGAGGTALATIAAAATGALPASGGSMGGALGTQQVNLNPGYSLNIWNGGYGSHGWTGGSGGNVGDTPITMTPSIYGWGSSIAGLAQFQAADGVADVSSGGGGLVNVSDYLGNGASGNRNIVSGNLFIGSTPATAGAYSGLFAQAQLNAPMPTAVGYGAPAQLGGMAGQMETSYTYGRVNQPGLFIANLTEPDLIFDPSQGVGENIGSTMIDSPDGAPGAVATSTANTGRYPGRFVNIGYDVLGWGVRCAFCVGKATSQWSMDQYATMFGLETTGYGGAPTVPVLGQYGLDLRPMTFSASSIAAPGFGVGPAGDVAAHSVTTGGAVSAATATLTGATILDPGNYAVWPTLTVAPPPMGGTTATMTVSAVAANGVGGFGATGSGYKVNDVVAAPGFGATSPTWTVSAVDGNGGITALTANATTGLSGVPANHVVALTGGSGTGATILVNVTHDSGDANWSASAGAFMATGAGYKASDTVTIGGDTGTAAVLTVTKVSPQGGIMFDPSLSRHPGVQVSTAGSLTAIASGTYHTSTTSSGSGTGASLLMLYGVTGITTTPGSGYLPQPLPVVTPAQSGYGNVRVQAVMTTGPNTGLALNGITVIGQGVASASIPSGQGGQFYNSSGSALPLNCAFSAPQSGVPAACSVLTATTSGLSFSNLGSAGQGYTANAVDAVLDNLGNTVGYVTITSVGSGGSITGLSPYYYSTFPLSGGQLPSGPFTIQGGTAGSLATLTAINSTAASVGITDPGAGYLAGTMPSGTVTATQNQQAAGSVTGTVAPIQRTAANELVTGNLTVSGTGGIATSSLLDNGNATIGGNLSAASGGTAGIWQGKGRLVTTITGATTLGSGNCDTFVRDNASAAHNVTVPTGLPLGCRVGIIQIGTGAPTVVAGSGVTLEAASGAATSAGQYATMTVVADSASTAIVAPGL